MLDKKIAVVVVALTLLSATIVLGATNLIVNGSGILTSGTITTGTQKAPPEVELIIGQSGSPANILVITQANQYLFNGNVSIASIGIDGAVKFSGMNSVNDEQYSAIASKIGLNTWTLEITQDGITQDGNVTGRLQITT